MENRKTNIVFLDAYTTNPGDLSWAGLESLGELDLYDRTHPDQLVDRIKNAEIIISNKVSIDQAFLDAAPKLKLVCVAATGYNNVDIGACALRNIPVCNVSGYSTKSVAQHVFAILLSFLHQPLLYALDVRSQSWSKSKDFAYTWEGIESLSDKIFGIYGLGNIGREVAKIAHAFGMRIIAINKYPERSPIDYIENVKVDQFWKMADVISLHAPLNSATKHLIDEKTLKVMKPSAILINTARGGLVNELDLYAALKKNVIRAALLDVLDFEPPENDHPLTTLDNCFITPHQAWINQAARRNLLLGICENIKAFQVGAMLDNRVN